MTSAYLSRPLRSFAEALLASRCPYPVLPDKTVAACIAADCCGCDNRDALAPAPRIVTTHVYPPVPFRDHDWLAFYEGEDDLGMDQGWGATEAEAIEDLRENFPRGDEA